MARTRSGRPFLYYSLSWIIFQSKNDLIIARNVATTSDGRAIATIGETGGLVTRDLNDLTNIHDDVVGHPLPQGITSLDDVSIDPTNEELIFAISVRSRRICSYRWLSISGTDGDEIEFVSCSDPSISVAVSPFVGISAYGGSVIVSGGTGGFSIFSYDMSTGSIDPGPPQVFNLELEGVVGHPDVLLINESMAALSTDFQGGSFGTRLISFGNNNDGVFAVRTIRDYQVPQSIGFRNAAGPANFPLVNAVLSSSETNDQSSAYLYTANGQMTVQNILRENGETFIISMDDDLFPSNFDALTVAVSYRLQRVIFGGVAEEGSYIVILDTSLDPIMPTFVQSIAVDGRISSIAIASDVDGISTAIVAFVTLGVNDDNGGVSIGSVNMDTGEVKDGGKIDLDDSGNEDEDETSSSSSSSSLLFSLSSSSLLLLLLRFGCSLGAIAMVGAISILL